MATKPNSRLIGSLFSGHHEETGWTAPTELPDLARYPKDAKFGFDSEFKYVESVHTDSQVAGISICTPDRKRYYLPVGHKGGGNLDSRAILRWAKQELAGRHLCILNAKDDIHVMYRWGLDLESIGAKLHDPAFKAALLDENRMKYNLNILLQDVLGRSKAEVPGAKTDIFDMSAGEVGSYAEQDAQDHLDLDEAQQKDIDRQELDSVCDLEDSLIYATASMERKGARLNRVKLERWIGEVEAAHQSAILKIYAETGLRVNPNSSKDLTRLFNTLNIPIPVKEEELGGGETFGEEYLSKVPHSAVRAVTAARKLDSLNSKYLKKYRNLLDSDNVVRYILHQLRTDTGDGNFGTVTGRFASSGGKDRKGINVQQVMKVESQLEEIEIMKWIVRELFIPADGASYISADASQIEFRWFAHYSKSDRLISDYCSNPLIDFHQLVANMLGQKRKDAKHNNFGKLYTMGIPKLARKLDLHCDCGCAANKQWSSKAHADSCRMHKAFAVSKEYDDKFPEAKALSNEAMKVAKSRGYVRTIMGRRRRYPTGERLHSALNAIIQGTAADTLKVKMLETYNHRKELTLDLRATVHDELDGDVWDTSKAKDLKELLEAPDSRIPCRVPLIWDVEVGKNWRETTE